MMMNDDDITRQIITYSKISNACALFCFNIVYYMNVLQIVDWLLTFLFHLVSLTAKYDMRQVILGGC